jgi:hypothetical protein
MGFLQVPAGFGWIATFSKPRFKASIKLRRWSEEFRSKL